LLKTKGRICNVSALFICFNCNHQLPDQPAIVNK
jgi:hypothetical protein